WCAWRSRAIATMATTRTTATAARAYPAYIQKPGSEPVLWVVVPPAPPVTARSPSSNGAGPAWAGAARTTTSRVPKVLARRVRRRIMTGSLPVSMRSGTSAHHTGRRGHAGVDTDRRSVHGVVDDRA